MIQIFVAFVPLRVPFQLKILFVAVPVFLFRFSTVQFSSIFQPLQFLLFLQPFLFLAVFFQFANQLITNDVSKLTMSLERALSHWLKLSFESVQLFLTPFSLSLLFRVQHEQLFSFLPFSFFLQPKNVSKLSCSNQNNFEFMV